MKPLPPLGLRHKAEILVTEALTVPAMSDNLPQFSTMPPVLATAWMIAFIEASCADAVAPYLSETQRTVGTQVDISHGAATPVGMTVTAEVELIASDGRKLRFDVVCRDETEIIGQGTHERFVIDVPRFMDRMTEKMERREG